MNISYPLRPAAPWKKSEFRTAIFIHTSPLMTTFYTIFMLTDVIHLAQLISSGCGVSVLRLKLRR